MKFIGIHTDQLEVLVYRALSEHPMDPRAAAEAVVRLAIEAGHVIEMPDLPTIQVDHA